MSELPKAISDMGERVKETHSAIQDLKNRGLESSDSASTEVEGDSAKASIQLLPDSGLIAVYAFSIAEKHERYVPLQDIFGERESHLYTAHGVLLTLKATGKVNFIQAGKDIKDATISWNDLKFEMVKTEVEKRFALAVRENRPYSFILKYKEKVENVYRNRGVNPS